MADIDWLLGVLDGRPLPYRAAVEVAKVSAAATTVP